MFPVDVFSAYSFACLLLIISPGPDNLLAIGRGLSQGPVAAVVSGMSSGAGILFHVVAASLGLTILMQTSEIAFTLVKMVGAAYLIWLGYKVLSTKSLFAIEKTSRQPLKHIFATGFLSAALNPKPGFFILAFVPQFVNPELGSVTVQMVIYGIWFALLTAFGFALMGIFSHKISAWLQRSPRVVSSLNTGAGMAFIGSGIAVALLKQK